MKTSQHVTADALTAAIREEVRVRFGSSLIDAQLIDSATAARMLDVTLHDLPGLLRRVNVAADGEKPRYRYRMSDVLGFIEARTLQPTALASRRKIKI